MANWNKLTESKYKAIKLLLKGGASQSEASEYMQVSTNTTFLVNKTENYEEYLQAQAVMALKKKNQVAAIKAKEAAKVAEQVGAVPASTLVKEEEKQKEPAPAQVVEYRQNVTIQATHYMMQEMQKANELLKLISSKLAVIVEDLYGTKEG